MVSNILELDGMKVFLVVLDICNSSCAIWKLTS